MKKLLVFALLPLVGLQLFAQTTDLRGLKTVVSQLEGGTAAVGRQYAVLIAIDAYRSWMALRNPVKDAKEIREILSRRYYISDFVELYDGAATKAGIIRLFDRLIAETKPEDSVLIFYAGHGHLDTSSNSGFWIPVDGGVDVYEQANWLPNSQVRGFIGNLKARHIALIADACFSGDFLNPSRGIAPTITNEYFRNAYARISRQVLTSGASESVPDESPFTRQLKLTLEGNTAPYLDPLMLYNQIRLGVTKTTPLFGDLRDSGHQEGSSFLLFLKNAAGPPGGEDQSTRMTIVKVYGAVTVSTDEKGTLSLDGVAQGEVPVGSLATIDNLPAGPHEIQLLYGSGERATRYVTVTAGSTTAVEFHRGQPLLSAAGTDALPSTVVPLQVASIKVDGTIDDWQNITPVFVGPPDAMDNRSISSVSLAMDKGTFFARLDVADKTPSSFFHAHNFNESPGYPTYGIDIDKGESQNNFSIRIVRWLAGWSVQVSVHEHGNQRILSGNSYGSGGGTYAMKGSSVEIAVPLAIVKSRLADLGPANQYRVTSWFATQTETRKTPGAGFFSF